MKCLWWTVLLVIQHSKRLHGQCIPIPNVTPGPEDPGFPELPDTFQTRVEANIKDKQKTFIAEEYYDYSNKKATLKITGDDETTIDIFDYKYDQLFHIFGNGSCAVMNISASAEAVLFGTATKPGGVPHIFTTSGVLHFVKKYGQVYKGTKYVRDINTDHWSTCIIWDKLNATFTLDYFFTTNDWNTAAGFPQIPVRAIATGSMNRSDGTIYQFEHYYEYVDFRVDLVVDNTIFETPKGVYCPGRKVIRNITRIDSPSVHFKTEIIQALLMDISSFDLWYDSDLQLARYDYKNGTGNPLREIHDFSTGIKYTTDMVTGSCTISPLNNNSNDINQRPFGEQMKDINHLMFLDGEYYYSGKRTARGVQCDVFTARKLFPFNNIQYNATFEFYFLAAGYIEYPSDGTTAPTDIPIRLEVTFNVPDLGDMLFKYNFLSYDIGKRAVSDFDISACYENLTSLRFQLRLPGPFRQQDTDLLKTEAQRVLPSIMNVTKVRLQSLSVEFDPSTVYLSGTLIDIAPDYAKFTFATTIHNSVGTTISTKSVDRTVAFTSNWKDCATRCIHSFGFICNSFDFCPNKTTPMCHLYKDRRTNINVYLQSHASPCLTYSVYQHEPKFIDGLTESVTANGTVGKNIKLMCKVASDPASFTTWYKQENIIDGSKRIRIFKNYLLIRKAKTEDIGEYQCNAENPFGNVVRHFVVNISTKHTNDNERKHGQTEDITMLRKEVKNLKNRVESLSSNDIHLHMYTGNDDATQHEVEKIGNGNHIYLNMLLKDYRSSNHVSNIHKDIHAHCEMTPNNNYEDVALITGNIHLVQRINGSVTVDIDLRGFDISEVGMSHEHGFNVHQFGDLSNSCDSLGDIYHRRSQRGHGHHGNRKSIMCDDNGEVNLQYTDNIISLHGQHSVIGRSFVVHDFKKRRMACCVIGRTETRDGNTVDKDIIHVKEEFIEHHLHKHVDPFRPDPTTEE